MSSNTDNKQALQADEVGEALHTALRKCCDSKESSYLWNVIHLLDETWGLFCKAVADANATTGDELKAVAEKLEVWWPDGMEYRGEKPVRESFYARQIFRVALDEFDEWDGFAAYLKLN